MLLSLDQVLYMFPAFLTAQLNTPLDLSLMHACMHVLNCLVYHVYIATI